MADRSDSWHNLDTIAGSAIEQACVNRGRIHGVSGAAEERANMRSFISLLSFNLTGDVGKVERTVKKSYILMINKALSHSQ